MFYTFDALSEFTSAERGLVVATMRAIEDKTGCVQFRKVESPLKTLMESFQGGFHGKFSGRLRPVELSTWC